MGKYQFEICTNSVESCLAAQEGGADRVELCAGIPEGGTTPSYGEIRTMLKDIEIARKLGADGVVSGCLTAEGEVDLPAMQKLMEAAQGLSVTFHRAFDVCRNPQRALEQIIKLGCNRILTSGQQPTAEQGIPLLEELQKQAAGRITLLAGCGVNENNIARIAAETGINEFHFSARESIQSEMIFKNEAVSMGGTVHINEYERNVTSIRRVKETIDAALHG